MTPGGLPAAFRALVLGDVAPAYLLGGEGAGLAGMLAEILERRFRDAGESVEVRTLSPQDFETGSPAMEWLTPSFFARRRLFVLPDLSELKRDPWKEIARYLDAPEPSAVLILPVADRKSFKSLSAPTPRWRAVSLREEEAAAALAAWAAQTIERAGKVIQPEAAEFLARWVGVDFTAMKSETLKLLSYAGEDQEVGEEAIRRVCVAGGGVDPFMLAGALFNRDARTCLGLLRRFAASADDRDYLALVGAIAWSARQRLSVRGGRPPGVVAGPVRERGAEVLAALSEIDRALKGESRLHPAQVVEIRLLKLLRSAG